MLRQMRDSKGRPNSRARVLALLVAAGLVALSAPAVISLVDWLAGLLW